MGQVRLEKTVDYKKLESALIKAAEEIGWKAQIKDEFEENYELGSVKKIKDYNYTCISLKGILFKAMQITIYGKKPVNYFYIRKGFPHGLASEKKIQIYLNAISRNLKASA